MALKFLSFVYFSRYARYTYLGYLALAVWVSTAAREELPLLASEADSDLSSPMADWARLCAAPPGPVCDQATVWLAGRSTVCTAHGARD